MTGSLGGWPSWLAFDAQDSGNCHGHGRQSSNVWAVKLPAEGDGQRLWAPMGN